MIRLRDTLTFSGLLVLLMLIALGSRAPSPVSRDEQRWSEGWLAMPSLVKPQRSLSRCAMSAAA